MDVTKLVTLRKEALEKLTRFLDRMNRYEHELKLEKRELQATYFNQAHYAEIKRRIRHKEISLAFLEHDVQELKATLKTQEILYGI